MADPERNFSIKHVTLGDLRDEACWSQWNDPDDIAPMTPRKRRIFLENPATQDEATIVQLLAVRDGDVIGREDLLPGALCVRGERVLTSWGSGMYVPERFRGQGIGKALAAEREAVHATCCSCGVSQMLLPIYRRLGWTDLSMPRFILLRSARPLAERVFGRSPVARFASGAGGLVLGIHRGVLGSTGRLAGRGLVVESRSSMPGTLDQLLSASPTPVAVPRSATWINWMLTGAFEAHERNRETLHLVMNEHGDPLGYLLTKTRYHETASHRGFRDVLLGSLQDWMVFEPEKLSFGVLAMLTVRTLIEQGVDAIEICLPPGQDGRGILRLMGFVQVGAQHALFKAGEGSPLADATLHRPAAWRIRPGDGDNVFN